MPNITRPLATSKLTFKNRLVYPPTCISKASKDGAITEETLAYYDEKTKDGCFSLVIIEHCFISQRGKASEGQVSVASDDMIPGLMGLARVVQENGSKIVLQMNHAGSCTEPSITGRSLIGPSALQNPRKGGVPEEMTKEDIAQVTQEFAQAAARAKTAGFDGVEIHSAHSYLLNQFYSPLSNHRSDEYGGPLENRVRLHLEVIEAVQKTVGEDVPVFLRLGACDHLPGGSQVEDAVKAAKMFEAAGVDVLDVSGGMCGYVNPNDSGPGYFGEEAKAIHQAVKIPVIVTGGVTKPEQAEALLEADVADFIGVGRAVMADSTWAKRAMERYQG